MTSKKMYYVLLGLLAVSIIAGFTGMYFTDKYLASQADLVADRRADDEVLSQKLFSAQTTRDNLEDLAFVDELAKEVLPDAKNQSEVILLISKIAKESGISTDSFNFASTEGNPGDKSQTVELEGTTGVLVLPINTSFRSTYNELIKFLEKTELNKRKMQISDISISPRLDDEGNPTDQLDVLLTINAYVKK